MSENKKEKKFANLKIKKKKGESVLGIKII